MSLKDAVSSMFKRKDQMAGRITDRARGLVEAMCSGSDGGYLFERGSGLSSDEAVSALGLLLTGLVTSEIGLKNRDADFLTKLIEEGNVKIALSKSLRDSSEGSVPLVFGIHAGYPHVSFVLVAAADSFKTTEDCHNVMTSDRFNNFLSRVREIAEPFVNQLPFAIRPSTDFSMAGLMRDPANTTHRHILY